MHDDGDRKGMHRQRARQLAAAALWCLPALALTVPKGLLPFGLLLLVSTLMAPAAVLGARRIGLPLALAGGVALLAMGVAMVSSHWSGGGGIDSRDRLLVLPWAMAWAWALQPPLAALWRGAMVGLACAVRHLASIAVTVLRCKGNAVVGGATQVQVDVSHKNRQLLQLLLAYGEELDVPFQLAAGLRLQDVGVCWAGAWTCGLVVQRRVDITTASIIPHT